MGFEDILREWEKGQKKKAAAGKNEDFNHLMEAWLREYPPEQKEEEIPRPVSDHSRHRIRRMDPQDSLDLHGHTLDEAVKETDCFLHRCKKRGLKKVLIIHGKGIHSKSGTAVLRKGIREYLRSHPLAGETRAAKRELGGDGATVVYVK